MLRDVVTEVHAATQHHSGVVVNTVLVLAEKRRLRDGARMANSIRYYRDKAGLSRDQVAARAGTSTQQIEKLEKGIRRLTDAWMRKIAPALGVSAADLMVARDESGALIEQPSKTVYDPDELALLRFWARLPLEDRRVMLRMIGNALVESTDGTKADDIIIEHLPHRLIRE